MNGGELRDLYQQVILEHARKPRNFGEPESGTCSMAAGRNPLCGDNFRVFVDVTDGVVSLVRFDGEGCAISKASASLMTQVLSGKTVQEARDLFDAFHGLVTSDDAAETAAENKSINLGKLAVFAGVREFPSRVKCASLAWHAMNAALDGNVESVSTESKDGLT
jgi:nitrogen fixation NifU-like protein